MMNIRIWLTNGIVYCTCAIIFLADICSGQTNWIPGKSDVTADLKSVVFGNGRFVAVGENGTLITSPDGFIWKKEASGTSFNLNDIEYGNGRYVVAGDSGTVLVSSDGITWERVVSGFSVNTSSMVYSNSNFVILKWYSSLQISDAYGLQWQPINPDTNRILYDIAYGNGIFLLPFYFKGYDSIMVSADLTSDWLKYDVDFDVSYYTNTRSLSSAFYLNSSFIVTGNDFVFGGKGGTNKYASFAAISVDGVEWNILYYGPWINGNNYLIRTIGYGNGYYVIVKDEYRKSVVYTKSEDDAKFVSIFETSDSTRLNSCASAEDRMVLVGNNGNVQVSTWETSVAYYPDDLRHSKVRLVTSQNSIKMTLPATSSSGIPASIVLFDLRGRNVFEKHFLANRSSIQIPIPELTSGMYNAKVKINNKVYCSELLIRQ
jgi:hypothetical protein